MLLLQVLLVLAVLALVAAVAAGQGDRLSSAPPDRADLRLPDGEVSARQVDDVRFTLAVRGYRQDEVDDALDRLSSALDLRDARIATLEAELAAALGDQAAGTGAPGVVDGTVPQGVEGGEGVEG